MWFTLAANWFGGIWNWLANNKLARQILAIVVGLALLLIGYNRWKSNVEKGVRRQEREAAALDAAKAETRIVTTIQENSDALVREAERVRSADAIVELPDGTKGLPEIHYRD